MIFSSDLGTTWTKMPDLLNFENHMFAENNLSLTINTRLKKFLLSTYTFLSKKNGFLI